MKKLLLVLALSATFSTMAQKLTLKKGLVVDSLQVNDSIADTYALYLPKNFDSSRSWPVLFVFDMKGRGKQSISMFLEPAEKEGYILAASNNVHDSLSIAKNVLATGRMITSVATLFQIDRNRVYTAGFSGGARLASLIPTFIKNVKGVISCGASVTNIEVLDPKKPFHFIGIVGTEDFNYPEMESLEKILNKKRFPNQLLVFEGGAQWPSSKYLSKALEIFTLSAMAKGHIPKDSLYVAQSYKANLNTMNRFLNAQNSVLAYGFLEEMIDIYRPHMDLEVLRNRAKQMKKDKLYRTQNRAQVNVFFKESLIKEDYAYYLEEDVLTYNYNNLGWWNFQMEELAKYDKSANRYERQMGKRLLEYLNALIADNMDLQLLQGPVDLEAMNFLWMLKTITEPKEYDNYLKIIANSAKMDDYGTALFYLEELLKNGYTDKTKLYALENTALLRITPEFNTIVEKYLKGARYEIIEE